MTITTLKETTRIINGTPINHRIVSSGIAYHAKTPDEIIEILEQARKNGKRIRLFYGDTKTGLDWCEESDTIGYVGHSTGEIKVPLLLSRRNSIGGGAILDHCIVRITIDKYDVYRHPNYHLPEFSIDYDKTSFTEQPYFVTNKNKNQIVAKFKTEKQAIKWLAFIKGERNLK